MPVGQERLGRRPQAVECVNRERQPLETRFRTAFAEEVEADVPHLEPPADVGDRLVDLARELHLDGRYA